MKKLFQVLFLALLMFSCGTEEDEGTTDTVDVPQDKQNLDQGIKDAINCIGRMGEGEAVESFKLFLGLSNGEVLDGEWVGDLMQKLVNSMELGQMNYEGDYAPESFDDIAINLADFNGTYEYNFSTQRFDFTENTNEIVVKMPSMKDKVSNNCQLTLSRFDHEKHSFDGENIPLPKAFAMSIEIDGDEIYAFNIKSIEYESYDLITIPRYIDASVVMSPYVINFTGEKNGGNFKIDYSMTSELLCDFSVEGRLNIAHDDFDHMTAEDLESASMKLTYGSVGVKGDVNLSRLLATGDMGDVTLSEINQFADVKVLLDGTEIGEVVMDETTDGEIVFNLVYRDGTKENILTQYLEPNADLLEAEVEDVLGSFEN